jgi:glycosyltransferase involved in cell wall biosynthesis
MTPDVSVVVPTWNRAHLLAASLASLLGQDGPSFEVVVVDDGSTDDTVARVEALGDPRVRLLARPHAGIAASRNAGVAAAAGTFVAFHDSDDEALPGRLRVPVAHLRAHPEVDFVVQNGRLLPPDDDPRAAERPWVAPDVAVRLAARPLGWEDVFRWSLGQLQGMTFTRRALAAVGPFDERLTILDDLDLVLRVAVRFRGAFLDVPAFAYRRHAAGVARDRTRVREEAIAVADKLAREHPAAIAALGPGVFVRRQARRWARLAEDRARAGDAVGARAALAAARALRPAHLGYRLRALWLVLGGPRAKRGVRRS